MRNAQGVSQAAQRAQQAQACCEQAGDQPAVAGQGDQQGADVLGPGAALRLLQVHQSSLQAAHLQGMERWRA